MAEAPQEAEAAGLRPGSAAGENPGRDGAACAWRLDILDVARGFALLAMALYHALWDIGFLRLTATNLALGPSGRLAARLIAGSFLFLVGVSLVLAHGRGVRWRAFLRRLGLISAAAGAITVATRFAFPDSYIFFGILHCIAVASLAALPFLRAPAAVTALAAGAALAAPLLLRDPLFDAPFLLWTGLGTVTPVTNDYVPLFPWFGSVLAGIAAARAALPSLQGRLARWRAKGRSARALACAGRHSLLVYLIHQPLLLAALYPLSLALGPHPQAEASAFQASFEESCLRRGEAAGLCRAAVRCLAGRLKEEGLWSATLADRLTAQEQDRARALSRACFDEGARSGPR